MRTLILLSAGLIACGTIAGPAAAATNSAAAAAPKPKTADACGAKYYTNLVGRDIGETQLVTDQYRLLPDGAARGATRATRLTFVYDNRTKLIVDVACG